MLNKMHSNDDYETPYSAFEELLPYLDLSLEYWDPFYYNGKSGEHLSHLGVPIYHSNENFFQTDHGDIVLSNPPYSKKKEIIEELVLRDKPFIMLMPIDTMCAKFYKPLINQTAFLIPSKRINFIKGKINPFNTIWYCYKTNLKNQSIIAL